MSIFFNSLESFSIWDVYIRKPTNVAFHTFLAEKILVMMAEFATEKVERRDQTAEV